MRSYGILAAIALASATGSAHAFWGLFECPPPHTHERAGNPQCQSKCAKPGRNCNYALGYIGGGCLGCKGEARPCDQGTFGYDYAGCIFTRPGRVFLNWCGCDGGKLPGPYKTDGPHVPDVFAIRPVKRACEKKHEKAECGEGHE